MIMRTTTPAITALLTAEALPLRELREKTGILDCIGPDGVVKNIIANVNIASDANIGGIANTSKGPC